MYVTPAQLIAGPEGAKPLAERYDIEPALLAVVIAGGDTSAWPGADIDEAEAALASIERFCDQAQAEVDTRLAVRGYPLPQDATRFPVLTVWSRSIALYHLNHQRDKTSEELGRIERDYRDALRALDLVAEGKLSLGAGDPLAPDPADAGAGAVRLDSQPRIFSRRSLRGL